MKMVSTDYSVKRIFVPALFVLIYLQISAWASCNYPADTIDDCEHTQIDSLIEITSINERCYLIKFGADAVTAINSKSGIIVIESGMSTCLSGRYRKIIEKEFNRNDFAYVVVSHGHFDHMGGLSVFPEAKTVGHMNCLQDAVDPKKNPEKIKLGLKKIADEYDSVLQKTKPNTEEWNKAYTQKIRYLSAYIDAADSAVVAPPALTFSDSLTIEMDDMNLELFYFGNSHSSSDILIYIPGLNILFTGDLFSKYGRPSLDEHLPEAQNQNQEAVHWIEKRIQNLNTVINGHGEILTAEDLKNFIKKIKEN